MSDVIRGAWYAVTQRDNLTTKPMKVTIHGQDYVLYRDEKGMVCAGDAYCPHRGCDLSLGTVEGAELICPFHGWRFDRDGRCTRVPANRGVWDVPKNAARATYEACEKAEWVWLYTAPKRVDMDASTEPDLFPELCSDNWTRTPFRATWHAHFVRVVESVLDVSHLPFVHPQTTGAGVNPEVDGPEYALTSNRILIHPKPFAPVHPMEPVEAVETEDERTEIELRAPNLWIIRTPMGDGNAMCTFLTFTPCDTQTTEIFGAVARNFDMDSPLLDEFHLSHTRFVMGQDQAIIESIRPVAPPYDLHREAHVRSDGPTVHYRTMMRTLLEEESLR